MAEIDSGLLDTETRVPAVFVKYRGANHLFDCGRTAFEKRFVNRLGCVFVSHTHFDHFCDLDGILAMKLNASPLCIFGPEGIFESVRSKVSAYNWNLASKSALSLSVCAVEGRRKKVYSLAVPQNIAGSLDCSVDIEDGVVLETDAYLVRRIVLNHKICSLGYSFEEKDYVCVSKRRLEESGLAEGAWVGELKRQVQSRAFGAVRVNGREYSFDELKGLLVPKKGAKIVYLTDFILDDLGSVASFASNADTLYCEAHYCCRDLQLARSNYHLTAVQAAEIAKVSGSKELVVFHFSPKYRADELIDEAGRFFPNVR